MYFDNASTTFPKPEVVYEAHDVYLRKAANPGRGAYKLAMQSAEDIFAVRQAAAELFGIRQPERLIFTPGCTYSINMALRGFPFRSGDIVLVSALEHNAVSRTLRVLEKEKGIRVQVVPYASKNIIDTHALIRVMLDTPPRLCVFSQASNVTGERLDLKTIGAICSAHKVPLMIDAAQTAGRTVDSLDDDGVSIWCASGHKGLFGAPGVGLLYINPKIELAPIITGGTGSRSDLLEMPDAYPDRLEPGTVAGPAIAALGAGIVWLKEAGVKTVAAHELALADKFINWANASQIVSIIGNRVAGGPGTGTVSFVMPGVGCDVIAAALDQQFGMAVRAGLHCAQAAHQALGTVDTWAVRVSFGYFNTEEEVDRLCGALEAILNHARKLGVR